MIYDKDYRVPTFWENLRDGVVTLVLVMGLLIAIGVL